VTTTTLDNATLPASFSTLATSANATIGGTLSVTNTTVAIGALPSGAAFNSLVTGGNSTNPGFVQAFNASGLPGTMLLNPGGGSVFTGSTLNINGSVLTGGNVVALQLPITSGTIALTPASGSYVTTVTINNATLPASVTTLVTSGAATIGGQLNVNSGATTTSINSSTDFIGLQVVTNDQLMISCLSHGTVNLQSTFNSFGSNGVLSLNPSGGAVSIASTGVTTTVAGPLQVNGNISTSGTGQIMSLNSGLGTGEQPLFIGSATTTNNCGLLFFNASGGTGSATNTVGLQVFGAALGSGITVNGSGNTNITGSLALGNTVTMTLPGTSNTNFLNAFESGLASSTAVAMSFGQSNATKLGGTINFINNGTISTNSTNFGLINGPQLTITGAGLMTTPNNTLDSGGSTGNAIVKGTLSVGTSVLTGGNAIALQLPTTAGTIALKPEVYSGTLTAGTTPVPVNPTAFTSGFSSISANTIGVPIGTFDVYINVYGTVPAGQIASIQCSVPAGFTFNGANQCATQNTSGSAQTLTTGFTTNLTNTNAANSFQLVSANITSGVGSITFRQLLV
jgi:hypothetical protein